MNPPTNSTTPIWGIHAGKTGGAVSLPNDSRYKSILPLRRIYVLELIDGAEE